MLDRLFRNCISQPRWRL